MDIPFVQHSKQFVERCIDCYSSTTSSEELKIYLITTIISAVHRDCELGVSAIVTIRNIITKTLQLVDPSLLTSAQYPEDFMNVIVTSIRYIYNIWADSPQSKNDAIAPLYTVCIQDFHTNIALMLYNDDKFNYIIVPEHQKRANYMLYYISLHFLAAIKND